MKDAILFLCALLLGGCFNLATAAEWLGPDESISGKYNKKQLKQLLKENSPALDENIKAVPLFRNDRSSNVLVQVRDREPLHFHADSDITVLMLCGEGDMRIGRETLPVKTGDVIHIERGAVHAFINRGPEPAAALVIASPPPGPEDRVLVEDK